MEAPPAAEKAPMPALAGIDMHCILSRLPANEQAVTARLLHKATASDPRYPRAVHVASGIPWHALQLQLPHIDPQQHPSLLSAVACSGDRSSAKQLLRTEGFDWEGSDAAVAALQAGHAKVAVQLVRLGLNDECTLTEVCTHALETEQLQVLEDVLDHIKETYYAGRRHDMDPDLPRQLWRSAVAAGNVDACHILWDFEPLAVAKVTGTSCWRLTDVAAEHGHIPVLRFFREACRAAARDQEDIKGMFCFGAFDNAVEAGHLDVLEWLLDQPDHLLDFDPYDLLVAASQEGHAHILQFLRGRFPGMYDSNRPYVVGRAKCHRQATVLHWLEQGVL